jgi:hypothetical protein
LEIDPFGGGNVKEVFRARDGEGDTLCLVQYGSGHLYAVGFDALNVNEVAVGLTMRDVKRLFFVLAEFINSGGEAGDRPDMTTEVMEQVKAGV